MPCIFLTLHSCIKLFYISTLSITTWVMCQHCVQLDQQLPSLITLLTFAFDCAPTRERRMAHLLDGGYDRTLSGWCGLPPVMGWARRPDLQLASASFSLVPCFSQGDVPLMHSHETLLMLPLLPVFFPVMVKGPFFASCSWIISSILGINFRLVSAQSVGLPGASETSDLLHFRLLSLCSRHPALHASSNFCRWT